MTRFLLLQFKGLFLLSSKNAAKPIKNRFEEKKLEFRLQ